MHICFLTPEYVWDNQPQGGLANYIKKTSHALIQRGHEVSVVIPSQQTKTWLDDQTTIYEIDTKKTPVLHKLRFSIIKFFRIPHYLISIYQKELNALAINEFVYQLDKEHRIDIIQISSFQAPGYNLSKIKNIPIICRISGHARAWRNAEGQQTSINNVWDDWMEESQLINTKYCISPSQKLISVFKNHANIEPKLIRTPIEESNIQPTFDFYNAYLKDLQYLVFYNRGCAVKGFDVLAEAMKTVFEKFPAIYIVFIGRNGYLHNKNQYAIDYFRSQNNHYSKQFISFSPIQKPELFGVINNSYGVLIPSRIDNLPNAALEAMMYSKPIVGTYDSSLDEIIEHEKTGLLAINGDANSLSENIINLLSKTKEQYQEMENNIQVKYQEIIKEDRIAQLIDYYEFVISDFAKTKRI